MTNTELIKTTCPGCDAPLRAPMKMAGKTIKCPHCQEPLQIPVTDDVANDSEPIAQERPRRASHSGNRGSRSRQKPSGKSKTPLLIGAAAVVITGILLFVFMGSGAGKEQVEWVELSLNNGIYSYSMPGKPKEKVKQQPGGQVVMFDYELNAGEIQYASAYYDFPDGLIGIPDLFFASSRDTILQSPDMKLRKERKIEVNGHPGRSYYFNHLQVTEGVADLFIMQQHIVLIDGDLYLFQTMAPKALAESEDVKKFHNSYILKK